MSEQKKSSKRGPSTSSKGPKVKRSRKDLQEEYKQRPEAGSVAHLLMEGSKEEISEFMETQYAESPDDYNLPPADPTDPFDRRLDTPTRKAKYPTRASAKGPPYPDMARWMYLCETADWLKTDIGRAGQMRDFRRVCFLGSDSEDDERDPIPATVASRFSRAQEEFAAATEGQDEEGDSEEPLLVVGEKVSVGLDASAVRDWQDNLLEAAEHEKASDQLFSIPVLHKEGNVHWTLGSAKSSMEVNPLHTGVSDNKDDAQLDRIAAMTRESIINQQRFRHMVSLTPILQVHLFPGSRVLVSQFHPLPFRQTTPVSQT